MSGALHAYLAGHGRDARARTADDVIALSDQELEASHDWVQWLFPLPTRSAAAPSAPVLSPSATAAIRADPHAVETLQRASERMIRFYAATDHWLAPYDHNHLRITRIIQSLRLLVGPPAARRFYDAVMALQEAHGAPVNAVSRRYWREAMQGA